MVIKVRKQGWLPLNMALLKMHILLWDYIIITKPCVRVVSVLYSIMYEVVALYKLKAIYLLATFV